MKNLELLNDLQRIPLDSKVIMVNTSFAWFLFVRVTTHHRFLIKIDKK